MFLLNLVEKQNGIRKNNRTGTDTLMVFAYHYKINLQNGMKLKGKKRSSNSRFTGVPGGRRKRHGPVPKPGARLGRWAMA